MKNASKFLLILIITSLLSYSGYSAYSAIRLLKVSKTKPVYHYVMKNGESIEFGRDFKLENSRTTASRGSYDGSMYRWEMSDGLLTIKEVASTNGIHQNDFKLNYCYGRITNLGDTTQVSATSNFDKTYLFDVSKNYSVDSFSKSIDILVVTKSLDDKKSLLLISTQDDGLNGIAIPQGVKSKEIYKEKHPQKTVAVFENFEITDDLGKTKFYPAGDYVLLGANKVKSN